jgi:hypothetical protein
MAETSWCHTILSKWSFRGMKRVLQTCLIFLYNPKVTLANQADVTIIIMLATPHTSAHVHQSLRIVFHAMKHHLYSSVKLTCSVKNLNSVAIMAGFLRCRSKYCPIWFRITTEGWRGRSGSQPEPDPHTFEIQIIAELTTNISRLAIWEQKRQNRGRTTTSVVYTECD